MEWDCSRKPRNAFTVVCSVGVSHKTTHRLCVVVASLSRGTGPLETPVRENRAGPPSTETPDLETTVRIKLWDTDVTKPQTLCEGPSACPPTGVSEQHSHPGSISVCIAGGNRPSKSSLVQSVTLMNMD